MVPYELLSSRESIVLTIAPTFRQVKTMWNEIETAIQALPSTNSPERSATSWRLSEKNYALGFSSSKGVNAQGFHGKRVLIIEDEAIGISPDLHDAIDGIRAGGDVRMVRLCNPTVPEGAVYDDFTRLRAQTECITISAFDTPNLEGLTLESLLQLPEEQLDVVHAPHLTRRRWVVEMYKKWGPENPRFRSRVLGEFPQQSDTAVFNLAWVERSKREPTEIELDRAKGSVIQFGIDVAGPGDDETACCARVNGIVLGRVAFMDRDPRGAVLRWLSQIRSAFPQYPVGFVVVDSVGIGYNFALHVADNGYQGKVYGFVAQQQAVDVERFENQKAEQTFRLRDMMQENYVSHLEGAWDEDAAAQMSGINYRETGRGRIQIEPKEDMRSRGVPSPDRFEAQVMAFCRVVPRQQGFLSSGIQEISPI